MRHVEAHDKQRTSLIIDVVPGSDPIRGTLTTSRGLTTPFCGWLELLGALQAQEDAIDDPDRVPDA
jgi:hypothetical protein